MFGRIDLSACEIDLASGIVRPLSGEPRSLSTRERELLAYLAEHRNRSVSRDELITRVWGYSDSVVSRACDNAVRRLRMKIEADPGRPEHLLTVHGEGYQLLIGPPAARGASEPAEHETEVPTPAPEALVALGPVTLDLERRRALTPDGDRSLSAREAALLRCLLAAGERGADRAMISRALGDQSATGRAIDNVVRRIRAKIELTDEPRFLLTERSGGYRLAVPRREPLQSKSRLIGREGHLQSLRDALLRSRWVLVTGPAGVGKSRLAREVACERDSLWIDLAAARTRDEMDVALARALHIEAREDLSDAIGRTIAKRGPLLLVLDNIEQLESCIGDRVASLRASAPGAHLLGTSQLRLGLDDEIALEIDGLSAEASAELFLERALAASSTSRLPRRDDADLMSLVSHLDGNPLAIELSAARSPTLSPRELLSRLEQRLDLLQRPRAENARHRSLRASIQSTWDLLEPAQVDALLLLSHFRSGFSVGDAEALLGVAAVDLLQELRDRSLVYSRPDRPERPFGIYEGIVAFTAEQRKRQPDAGREQDLIWARSVARLGERHHLDTLSRRDRRDAARHQHLRAEDLERACDLALSHGEIELASHALLGALWVRIKSGPFLPALERIDTLLAREGAERAVHARLLLAKARILRSLDRPAECEQVTIALDAFEGAERSTAADGWGVRANALGDLGRRRESGLAYQRAAALLESAGRPDAACWCNAYAEMSLEGDAAASYRAFERAASLARADGNSALAARATYQLSRFAIANGQPTLAEERLEEALALYDEAEDLQGQVEIGNQKLLLASLLGKHERAEADAKTLAALTARTASAVDASLTLVYLATSRLLRGDLPAATEAIREARKQLACCRELPRTVSYLSLREAELMLACGDAMSALQLASDARERFASFDRWNTARADGLLARIYAKLGRPREAIDAGERAVAPLRADDYATPVALAARGVALAASGDRERAAQDLREATASVERLGLSNPGSEASVALEHLRSALG